VKKNSRSLVLSDPKIAKLLDGLRFMKVSLCRTNWSTWWWDRKCVSHFSKVKDWEQAYLTERLPHDTAHFEAGNTARPRGWASLRRTPSKHTLRAIDALSVFIHSQVTPQVLEALPNLKFIATRSTGFDHVDLDACLKRGIVVSNVPSYGENTVAEHTMALLLMLSRKVHQSVLQVAQRTRDLADLTGFDLQGKTIGVIGAGHIGLHVIRIARGFGMRVLAYDVHSEPFLADLLGFTYATMNQLLAESDIVTLHCPLTEKNASSGRARADFSNEARGAADQYIRAGPGGYGRAGGVRSESGRLGGAGLDVSGKARNSSRKKSSCCNSRWTWSGCARRCGIACCSRGKTWYSRHTTRSIAVRR